jgi:hypothetical protein
MMHVFDDTLKENEKNKKKNIINDRDITNGKKHNGKGNDIFTNNKP